MENEVAVALTHADFGLLALFLRASFTVKIVIIILIAASVLGWSVVLSKWVLMRNVENRLVNFNSRFWSGTPLDQLFAEIDDATENDAENVFMAGMKEWRRNLTQGASPLEGAQERIERAMNVSLQSSRTRWEEGLSVLGTIGSTTPFIGLFGTVWGIKNSFQEIALAGSTSLGVVAPGIAEALVATALGLVAAIPAVVFYNKFDGDVDRVAKDHARFAEEFAIHISRKISSEKH